MEALEVAQTVLIVDDETLLLRTLLQECVDQVGGIDILEAQEKVEDEPGYRRAVGYEVLKLRFRPRS